MKIKELKDKYPLVYKAALWNQDDQGNCVDDELELVNDKNNGNFNWKGSDEGDDFWEHINNEEYNHAKELKPELFKEEEFVLPEKWCITTTKESNDTILEYVNKINPNKSRDRSIGNHHCFDNGNHTGWMHSAPQYKKGYTEITFEQFKKYVLKEQDTTITPKVGGKVKIVKEFDRFKKGEIYSIDKVTKHTFKINGGFLIKGARNYSSYVELLPDDCKEKWTPKVGDWVVGWHNKTNDLNLHEKAWRVKKNDGEYVYPENTPGWNCGIENVRKAEPHEIPLTKDINRGFPNVGSIVLLKKGVSGCGCLDGAKARVIDEGFKVSNGLLDKKRGFNIELLTDAEGSRYCVKGSTGRFNGEWEYTDYKEESVLTSLPEEYTVKVTTVEQFNEVLKYLIKETNTSSSEYDMHSERTMKFDYYVSKTKEDIQGWTYDIKNTYGEIMPYIRWKELITTLLNSEECFTKKNPGLITIYLPETKQVKEINSNFVQIKVNKVNKLIKVK